MSYASSQDSDRHASRLVRQGLSADSTHHAIAPHPDGSSIPPPLGSVDADSDDEDMADSARVGDTAPVAQPRREQTHARGGGDVVLIIGLPDVFTVGYDALSFTAKHFGGIRDIPAGPHLFWAAHPGGMATRSGFWIMSEGTNRVHAVKWDSGSELLGEAPPDEIPTDVDSFHAKLLSYRDPTARSGAGGGGSVGDLNETQAAENELIWGQMTNCITADLLSRVTGQSGGAAWHISTMDRVRGETLQSGEREMEDHISHIQHTAPLPVRELRFALDQHSKTYSAQRFGADRTLEATDATLYLTALLSDDAAAVTEASLVGELQFALLAGVHLGNEACLAQWWHMLLRLILRAYALPRSRPALAAAWLRAVTAQLTYGSAWLDTPLTELSDARSSRELRLSLIVYKRRLEEEFKVTGTTAEQAAVVAAFARLESVVAGPGFGWDIRGEYLRKGKVVMEDGEEVELEMDELQAEDERGEWAPEVVELDEHGREKGLISWND
ncbi:AAR2 family protein [Akanthomyces lecanii RCEF 1005]|uniref:AAR2 family protein n=1 Tax=Akanthomyces lecanii RCEF 1005 TaxID=1081108 RepID=A0A168I6P9_CORDF|nr:AAR2 family protein [Akanthomyces lecanii RCEF 1005]